MSRFMAVAFSPPPVYLFLSSSHILLKVAYAFGETIPVPQLKQQVKMGRWRMSVFNKMGKKTVVCPLFSPYFPSVATPL